VSLGSRSSPRRPDEEELRREQSWKQRSNPVIRSDETRLEAQQRDVGDDIRLIDLKPCLLQHGAGRVARVKAEMGPIEDSAVLVRKSTRQQVEANGPMGDVGNRHNKPTSLPQEGEQTTEGPDGIHEMLEHVNQENRIEVRKWQGQGHRRQVSDEDVFGEPPGLVRSVRPHFDAGNSAPHGGNMFRKSSATASDFEHAVASTQVCEGAHVGAVRDRVEDIVVGHRTSPASKETDHSLRRPAVERCIKASQECGLPVEDPIVVPAISEQPIED